MKYLGCTIRAEFGEYAAWYGNDLVATAPSKGELFAILDGIVSRYRRNK